MGYACPVCEDPQADGEHLANHLAFTAVLGDDAHEAWLDERVPDWGERDPASLAETVVDYADERAFPQVFEDTTDAHDHGSGDAHGHSHPDSGDAQSHDHVTRPVGGDDEIPETAGTDLPDDEAVPPDVLAEAREMTRERRERADPGGDGEDDSASESGD